MDLRYDLSGTFVESCTCEVICPCWVDDTPDEDHCSGFFAWTFARGSTIEGHDVSRRTVVSVTVHGDRRRGGESESVLFVDRRAPREVADLLVTAFSGDGGGPLGALRDVTGDVLAAGHADVTVTADGDGFLVSVHASGGAQLLGAHGRPERFDESSEPLTLRHTALSRELGMASAPATAHRTEALVVDIQALPGHPVDVTGRSAMRGRFRYRAVGGIDEDVAEAEHVG
ncbi:MAG: DUF1326 domain-containing protein [Dermatophilaceae bacterium]